MLWADSDLLRRQLVRGHLARLCLLGEASPKTCGKDTAREPLLVTASRSSFLSLIRQAARWPAASTPAQAARSITGRGPTPRASKTFKRSRRSQVIEHILRVAAEGYFGFPVAGCERMVHMFARNRA
jgi:hypothetical protein